MKKEHEPIILAILSVILPLITVIVSHNMIFGGIEGENLGLAGISVLFGLLFTIPIIIGLGSVFALILGKRAIRYIKNEPSLQKKRMVLIIASLGITCGYAEILYLPFVWYWFNRFS